MDIGDLVEMQQTIRAARSNLKRAFEDEDNKLSVDLRRVEAAILKFLMDNGLKSVKTETGTAYQQEEILPTCSDWGAFFNWVRQTNAFDALEKRVKKTFIKEYMDNEGDLPPGISVIRENVVRVRKT